ncbi:MAG: T9SS type A sorting domain-containing protein, partial [Chitinophagaceae bacterium]
TAYGLFIRGLSSEVTGTNYTAGPSAFTYSLSGTLNDNSVSYTPANTSNYFIVGNPYAAPVNTLALTGGVSRGYVTYQITQGGSQTAQRTRAGSWIVAGGNSSTNSTLPVLGTLAFIPSSTNSFNVTNSNINIFGTPVTNLFSTNNEIQQIGISIEQSGQLLDRIYIRQEANNNERLPKFKNDIVNLYIQTTDDKALSIESKANLFGRQQLAISAPKGNYQLSINHNSLPANITTTLVDNYLQTETKLIANAVYNFTINNDSISQGNKRFYVVFTNSNMASVIEEMPIAKAFKAVVVANVNNTKIINIYLENAQNNQAQVLVRDVLGRTISSNYISNGTNSIIAPNTNGIYIIEINDGIHKKVKKIIQ